MKDYWRTGGEEEPSRVIYRIVDNNPSGSDEPIGMMDTPELARYVVAAMNLAFRMGRAAIGESR